MSAEIMEIFDFLGVEPVDVVNKTIRLNVAGSPKNKLYERLEKFMYQPNLLKSFLKGLFPVRMRVNWKNSLGEVLFRHEPIPIELREKLTEEYQVDILALGELIGRDLSRWLR